MPKKMKKSGGHKACRKSGWVKKSGNQGTRFCSRKNSKKNKTKRRHKNGV